MAKIHPQAIVESDDIGDGTCIWAFAHVLRGAQIGTNVNIGDHTFVEGGAVIGNNVTVKNQVCIWEGITIDDDVFVGPRVTFTNDRYPRSPRMEAARARYAARENWLSKTYVHTGCSIGAAATICPGIELGPYSVIGAGAVVTQNVPAFALMLGAPARHRGDVCTCGKPLDGTFDTSRCVDCGESGADRVAKLARLAAQNEQSRAALVSPT